MPTNDVSDLWLRLSYFFITHRTDLRKWWVLLMGAVDLFLIVFVMTNLVILGVTWNRNTGLVIDIADRASGYETLWQATAPKPLTVVSTFAIPSGEKQFDLLAKVKNPNAVWAVEKVAPTFSFRGSTIDAEPDFLLPGEERYLVTFGVRPTVAPSLGAPDVVSVSFDEPKWLRVADRESLPFADFASENVIHRVVSGRSSLTVSEVTGEVMNRSLLNFWSVRVKIIAFAGTSPVGVNQAFLDRVSGLSRRSFSVQWTSALPVVTDIIVVPEVNILESGSTYAE